MEKNKIKIRKFLSNYIKNNEFKDGDHLFQKGFVNSLLAMEMVVFVENTFSIQIGNEDLNLENFKSVNAMSELIDRKTRNN